MQGFGIRQEVQVFDVSHFCFCFGATARLIFEQGLFLALYSGIPPGSILGTIYHSNVISGLDSCKSSMLILVLYLWLLLLTNLLFIKW